MTIYIYCNTTGTKKKKGYDKELSLKLDDISPNICTLSKVKKYYLEENLLKLFSPRDFYTWVCGDIYDLTIKLA